MSNDDITKATAERVMELAEEVEASAEATFGGSALESARATLHAWVDSMKAVVVNPAQGRVTVIHENGRQSTITSPDLPYVMSAPVKARPAE